MSEGWRAEVVACLVRSRGGELGSLQFYWLAGRRDPSINQSSNVTPNKDLGLFSQLNFLV